MSLKNVLMRLMDMVEEFVYRNEPLPDDKPIAIGWNNGTGLIKQ